MCQLKKISSGMKVRLLPLPPEVACDRLLAYCLMAGLWLASIAGISFIDGEGKKQQGGEERRREIKCQPSDGG